MVLTLLSPYKKSGDLYLNLTPPLDVPTTHQIHSQHPWLTGSTFYCLISGIWHFTKVRHRFLLLSTLWHIYPVITPVKFSDIREASAHLTSSAFGTLEYFLCETLHFFHCGLVSHLVPFPCHIFFSIPLQIFSLNNLLTVSECLLTDQIIATSTKGCLNINIPKSGPNMSLKVYFVLLLIMTPIKLGA